MRKAYLVILSLLFVLLYFSYSCQITPKKDYKEGEKLAKVHCATCHLYPEPSLLDKKSWSDVLPKMAEFMNVKAYYNPFNSTEEVVDSPGARVVPAKVFSDDDWEKIYNYYYFSAPVKSLSREKELSPVSMGLKLFRPEILAGKSGNPLTTFLQIDTTAGGFWFADGAQGKLFKCDNQLLIFDSLEIEQGVVGAQQSKDKMEVLSMGILKPSDKKFGKLSEIDRDKKTKIILDSLNRPVHYRFADLNGDGKEDIIVCEFGFRRGDLSWFEKTASNTYQKHILRSLPGAVRTEVYDFNKDGRPDIIAQMAQGDEGLFIYYNEGNGKFREENIIRFPPVYGSNHFDLFDYNRDGFMDILTTNGDNADYSISLKAYHGIRIFVNNGNNKFEEKVFLPVYGIQKAIPADFDNDGDIDIASISFFPDYKNLPEESFIFWENKGDGQYLRYSFPEATSGRWMIMDAGDMDGDGDKDIVLGCAIFSFGEVTKEYKNKWMKNPVSVLVLKNTLKN